MTKHVGFTGTQRGMTPWQRSALETLLQDLNATDFHHGDCCGADEEAHEVATLVGCRIYLHPPIIEAKRAHCNLRAGVDLCYQAKPYLDRNKDIVNTTECLIATPGESKEQLRSGTWSTVRYARKRGKFISIILPNGAFM